MSELRLITYSDFLPYRAITSNIDDQKRLDPHIEETQRIDLIKALGQALFFDLLKYIASYTAALALDVDYNATDDEQHFLDLLNGKTYNHTVKLDGHDHVLAKIYPGLKPFLVYMTYKRFVSRDNIRSTPSGFVTKNTMESTPATATQISQEANRAEQDARQWFTFVQDYMKDNKDYFDKYLRHLCGCDSDYWHSFKYDGYNAGSRRGFGTLSAPRNRDKVSRRFGRNDR